MGVKGEGYASLLSHCCGLRHHIFFRVIGMEKASINTCANAVAQSMRLCVQKRECDWPGTSASSPVLSEASTYVATPCSECAYFNRGTVLLGVLPALRIHADDPESRALPLILGQAPCMRRDLVGPLPSPMQPTRAHKQP